MNRLGAKDTPSPECLGVTGDGCRHCLWVNVQTIHDPYRPNNNPSARILQVISIPALHAIGGDPPKGRLNDRRQEVGKLMVPARVHVSKVDDNWNVAPLEQTLGGEQISSSESTGQGNGEEFPITFSEMHQTYLSER